jgi:hypothetical protein
MWAREPSNAFLRADASGHGEQRLAGGIFPTAPEEEAASSQTVWNAAETLESGAPVVLTLPGTSAERRTEFILILFGAQTHSNGSQRELYYFQATF